jgi:hypothetical protein
MDGVEHRGSAFKLKSSGKEVSTDKASRADVLRISYNCRKSSCDKVQNHTSFRLSISKNNVLGDKNQKVW